MSYSKYLEELTRLRAWNPGHEDRLLKIKRDLAHALDRSTLRLGYSQRQLACALGTSQGHISEVLGSNLKRVSVNQQIKYLIVIEPRFQVQIAI